MAVRARNRKKAESTERWKKVYKLKCCYCANNEGCAFRARKEEAEDKGIPTYCKQAAKKVEEKKANHKKGSKSKKTFKPLKADKHIKKS
jgi:hypothetical protein